MANQNKNSNQGTMNRMDEKTGTQSDRSGSQSGIGSRAGTRADVPSDRSSTSSTSNRDFSESDEA